MSGFLDRQEAITVLKEINGKCDGYFEKGFVLKSPSPDDELSQGYQLHIKADFDESHVKCIKPIVEKHKLEMANEQTIETLVIYKPRKNKK